MTEWMHARVREIRERMAPDDEETLWVLYFDDPNGEPATGSAIVDGARYDADGLRALAGVIDELRPPAVLLAVTRRSGTPRPSDARLLTDLRQLLFGPTEVVDLLVVGRHTWCSAVVAA